MGHAGRNLQGHKMDEELQADGSERKERESRDCEGGNTGQDGGL